MIATNVVPLTGNASTVGKWDTLVVCVELVLHLEDVTVLVVARLVGPLSWTISPRPDSRSSSDLKIFIYIKITSTRRYCEGC